MRGLKRVHRRFLEYFKWPITSFESMSQVSQSRLQENRGKPKLAISIPKDRFLKFSIIPETWGERILSQVSTSVRNSGQSIDHFQIFGQWEALFHEKLESAVNARLETDPRDYRVNFSYRTEREIPSSFAAASLFPSVALRASRTISFSLCFMASLKENFEKYRPWASFFLMKERGR